MMLPTRVMFRDFIELADVDTINSFLATTTFTLGSGNLELLSKCAYKEGFKNSQSHTTHTAAYRREKGSET